MGIFLIRLRSGTFWHESTPVLWSSPPVEHLQLAQTTVEAVLCRPRWRTSPLRWPHLGCPVGRREPGRPNKSPPGTQRASPSPGFMGSKAHIKRIWGSEVRINRHKFTSNNSFCVLISSRYTIHCIPSPIPLLYSSIALCTDSARKANIAFQLLLKRVTNVLLLTLNWPTRLSVFTRDQHQLQRSRGMEFCYY